MATTAVFIHGACFTPACWDRFVSRYSACAFNCIAPDWRRPAEAATSPGFDLGALLAWHESLVRRLPEPPLLVGHSLGGLLVQLLLDRGLGAAGIAINAVPPASLRARFQLLPLWWPLSRGWKLRAGSIRPDARVFADRIAQDLSPHEARRVYEEHVVTAPARVLVPAILGVGTGVDFANDRRAPLLLIAGDADRLVPATLVADNRRRYLRSAAATDFRSFPGRTHWSIAGRGWEDVADFTIEWANNAA